jgi:hypothetical protein
VISVSRSQLRHKRWYTALPVAAVLAALLLISPQSPSARIALADDTPPVVSDTIDGINGTNGWYRGSTGGNFIVVHWLVSDPDSPVLSTTGCEPAVQINGPTTGTTRTCSATSQGGTTTVTTKLLKIDATAPDATASPNRSPNGAGWFNSPLSITWSATDATSGVASCRTALAYNGPDTTGTTESGTCTDNAGNSSSDSYVVKYDTAPPTTTASPSRSPNAAGWFNSPLSVSWSGSDATSGIASCRSTLAYNGPDTTGSSQSGTCTDNAGNSSSDTYVVKYDSVAPATTASPSRAPNAAGWYRTPVSISWGGTDGTSGIASCRSTLNYSSPDTTGTTETGTCTDNAGNSSSDSYVVKYDSTPPATQATSSPAANANGWFKAPLFVNWGASDATSGVDTCTPSLAYSGPDTAGALETGTCTDKAGNSSSGNFTVRYDHVAPNTDAAPSRSPNAAGWFNSPLSIGWSGTDGLSGIDSCSSTVNYSGPDTTGATRTGSCTDKAGNSSSDSYVVKYDSAPPTGMTATPARSTDHEGWYNHPLRVDWGATDSTSGLASCTSRTYSSPDTANATLSGSCTDVAGNSATLAFGFQYDASGPAVTVTPARSPDHDGWYNHPVAISWSGTDPVSGLESCTQPLTYSAPDDANASSAGGCTDHAGNSASPPALAFKYDATAPTVTAQPSRLPDANGWYNHQLAIGWTGSDPVAGIASCSSALYQSPDSASASRSGQCTDRAGNTSAPVAFRFRYDATPPAGLAVSPGRPPDHDGWYNHPLGVTWSGVDGLAGVASCTALTYGSPNAGSGQLSGRCTDRAGNTSPALGFGIRYDQTPPSIASLALKGLDDTVQLKWRVSGADDLRITRSPGMKAAASSDVYAGDAAGFSDKRVENYTRYRYTLTAEDEAGNTVTRTATATPMPVLFAPRPDARMRARSTPRFAWRPATNADYYNVQLWLRGRKVGSWWPTGSRLQLPARWRAGGQARRLVAGDYTWYVWPGRGARKLGRYGRLLGQSTFSVR